MDFFYVFFEIFRRVIRNKSRRQKLYDEDYRWVSFSKSRVMLFGYISKLRYEQVCVESNFMCKVGDKVWTVYVKNFRSTPQKVISKRI